MSHRCNSLRIIDNLAEITSHHDRQVLEKSLLKTLNELFPGQSMRLFRVRHHQRQDDQEVTLLAFCVNDVIVSSDENPSLNQESVWLHEIMSDAVKQGGIQVRQAEDGSNHIAYPAFDSHGDIFAVLVHHCQQQPDSASQRLIHGILRVYANYLALIDKSQRDKLTNLYNRETLDEQITKILVKQSDDLNKLSVSAVDSRRRHYAVRYWLGLVDIDNFKRINDTYGHLFGDEVLILVARLMTSGAIRDDDLIFRYGGEEFVVLLKAAQESDAQQAFERLRRIVSAHVFPQIDGVTVSIGFVEVADQVSPADVLGQADDALYYAKQQGRDQVHNYQQLVTGGKIAIPPPVNNDSSLELF
ncbi:diguanylate cyclase (GGDEF) domain-containing protein [Methylophaga frappieri]|uniref:diguanylate cyclase n=1 Tax=Methylophaga frappieri (strain ATCC BAA-2434 / DSM 25690 / JAM7) TaxID=754477 RepID=I1YGZ1_METFJ|nr:GGDEF domain-containing protein [Methylophaga frappieri]AFJ02184.1 diguanylate cyclase (GGDEF) domain-containing protein [Methylophaga frappieri]